MAWDHRYRMLDEGEIITPTDECQQDDGSWRPDSGRCAGRPAPSPHYTSHRVYRRHIRAEAAEARAQRLRQALQNLMQAESTNAQRMRNAIVEARARLAKGRALWNGPCHECDAVLEQALRADNGAEAIARAALEEGEKP